MNHTSVHVAVFDLGVARVFPSSELADPVEVGDDAAPRDDDDGERQRVQKDHPQQEVEELGRVRGERAEGHALPVPRVVGMVPGAVREECDLPIFISGVG